MTTKEERDALRRKHSREYAQCANQDCHGANYPCATRRLLDEVEAAEAPAKEIVRVLRVLEYVGERSWVEQTVARAIHGEKHFPPGVIKAATVGVYPEPFVLHVDTGKEST